MSSIEGQQEKGPTPRPAPMDEAFCTGCFRSFPVEPSAARPKPPPKLAEVFDVNRCKYVYYGKCARCREAEK